MEPTGQRPDTRKVDQKQGESSKAGKKESFAYSVVAAPFRAIALIGRGMAYGAKLIGHKVVNVLSRGKVDTVAQKQNVLPHPEPKGVSAVQFTGVPNPTHVDLPVPENTKIDTAGSLSLNIELATPPGVVLERDSNGAVTHLRIPTDKYGVTNIEDKGEGKYTFKVTGKNAAEEETTWTVTINPKQIPAKIVSFNSGHR